MLVRLRTGMRDQPTVRRLLDIDRTVRTIRVTGPECPLGIVLRHRQVDIVLLRLLRVATVQDRRLETAIVLRLAMSARQDRRRVMSEHLHREAAEQRVRRLELHHAVTEMSGQRQGHSRNRGAGREPLVEAEAVLRSAKLANGGTPVPAGDLGDDTDEGMRVFLQFD